MQEPSHDSTAACGLAAATGHAQWFVDHRGRLCPLPAGYRPIPRQGLHAAVLHGHRLLLVCPPGGDWLELPGGGIEPGEAPTTALQRELREEAGLRLDASSLLPLAEVRVHNRYYAQNHDAYWLYDQRFRLIHIPQQPPLDVPEEPGHVRHWIPLPDLHEQPIHHLHRAAVDQLLGPRG